MATRGSPLALAQTRLVLAWLQRVLPEFQFELCQFKTVGDHRKIPFQQVGGLGIFIKELEQALLADQADFAVHSLKDVPASETKGLSLVSFPKRGAVRDVLLTNDKTLLRRKATGAVVATSSLRRQCFLANEYPALKTVELRGNIDTRIVRLSRGEWDGIVLAEAGLGRLASRPPQLASLFQLPFSPELMCPAPGQGAVVLQCLTERSLLHSLLRRINHPPTETAVLAERLVMSRLAGGCSVPLGVYGRETGEGKQHFLLSAMWAVEVGGGDRTLLTEAVRGERKEALTLARQLAERLQHRRQQLIPRS